jgi:hypothetical protein
MPNNIPAKIVLDSQPYSDGRRKRAFENKMDWWSAGRPENT